VENKRSDKEEKININSIYLTFILVIYSVSLVNSFNVNKEICEFAMILFAIKKNCEICAFKGISYAILITNFLTFRKNFYYYIANMLTTTQFSLVSQICSINFGVSKR
jgi:hypothetical protein